MRRTMAACAILAWSAVQAGQLTIGEHYPLRGEATEVIVTDDAGTPVQGAVVRLTYRPNSMVSREDSLAPTDSAGRASWIPSDAGICTMRARLGTTEIAARDVSVRFDRFPLQGAIVMIVAFCALFGGAAFSLTMLFKAEQEGKGDAGMLVRGT